MCGVSLVYGLIIISAGKFFFFGPKLQGAAVSQSLGLFIVGLSSTSTM